MANENYRQSDIVARNCVSSFGARVGRLRYGAQGGTLRLPAAWIGVYHFPEQHRKLWVGELADYLEDHRAHVGGKTDDGVCIPNRNDSSQC